MVNYMKATMTNYNGQQAYMGDQVFARIDYNNKTFLVDCQNCDDVYKLLPQNEATDSAPENIQVGRVHKERTKEAIIKEFIKQNDPVAFQEECNCFGNETIETLLFDDD